MKTPHIILVWDTDAVTDEEYLELRAALGDLVRAAGGLGLERIKSTYFSVSKEPEKDG